SEIILSPEEAEKHQKRLNEKMGSAGDFNSVIQSGAKVKYQPIALSPTDLKIIESRVMKLRDLCNAYAVDSSLFNDPANKTYNNRTEAHKSFYSDAVIPTLNKFLTIFRPAINAYSVRENRDYRLKLDLSGVHALQEDENEKAQRGVNISNTIITILASNLTREQKINALVESLQITYERAEEMVGNEITFDEGTN
nr:phage portal protein [Candidatus Aenigmarchaeota archaeon]NIQ16181.1 phage portal protein [Candidatus Dadabacteria bacterium]